VVTREAGDAPPGARDAVFKTEKKPSRGPAGKWDVVIGEDM
jgi:hypothetical protein